MLVALVSQCSVLLVFQWYRTSIARYVAEWGIALICLCCALSSTGQVEALLCMKHWYERERDAIGTSSRTRARTHTHRHTRRHTFRNKCHALLMIGTLTVDLVCFNVLKLLSFWCKCIILVQCSCALHAEVSLALLLFL